MNNNNKPFSPKKSWIKIVIFLLILGLLILLSNPLLFLVKNLGTKVLCINLFINQDSKTVFFRGVEGLYGFLPEIPENNFSEQVVRVIREGKVIYEQPFQIEEKGYIISENGDFFDQEELIFPRREDFIVVPYLSKTQIVIEDIADGFGVGKRYLTINNW